MIDKLGARVIMVITAGICCLGQAVFFSGGYKNLFWLMLIGNQRHYAGRGIFGVGGESLMASQNTLLSNWFEPSQLSVFAVHNIARFGDLHQLPKVRECSQQLRLSQDLRTLRLTPTAIELLRRLNKQRVLRRLYPTSGGPRHNANFVSSVSSAVLLRHGVRSPRETPP